MWCCRCWRRWACRCSSCWRRERGDREAAEGAGGGAAAGIGAALKKVLDGAFKEAENFKDEYVSTEHLLLALAKPKNEPVQMALAAQGADA